MLFTDVQLFGVLTIIYLGMWLIAVSRYLLCAYASKRCDMYQVQRLASRARNIRKRGWWIFFLYPPLLLTLPTVTVITQNTNFEMDGAMERKVEYDNISNEEALIRNSFNHKNYLTLFFFNGVRLYKGKYIFNNTDSTLHIYTSRFYEQTPRYVDGVNEGTDIPARSLVKFYYRPDCYFENPEPGLHQNKKEKGKLTEILTIDVKSLAQKQKNQISQHITNENWDEPRKIVLPAFPSDGINYMPPKTSNKEQSLDGQRIELNLKNAEGFIDSISRVEAKEASLTYSNPCVQPSEFQKEIAERHRKMDSVKSILLEKSENTTQSQIPVSTPTTESEKQEEPGR